MEQITLKEITDAVKGDLTNGDAEDTVSDVCIDTRNLSEGCLFIAIAGENFDGHDYIEKSFELGAKVAISEKEIESSHPIIKVKDTRKALMELAKAYRKRFPIFLVGVTGSVGKTSTKEMIYAVLSQKYRTLETKGNLNNEIGLPMTLFNLDSTNEAAVIEMGMSNFGEIRRLSQTAQPSIGIITNIGVSHIENLGSRDAILQAKLEIVDGLPEDAAMILNADDDMLSIAHEYIGKDIIYYGVEEKDTIKAENIKTENLTTTFDIVYYGKVIPAKIPTIGVHNVYNALAAFCVGIIADMSEEDIVAGLSRYKTAGMRQNIKKVNGITIIEDCYNASPESMQAAINVLGQLETKGRRVAVLGDMLELGDYSSEMHNKVGGMTSKIKLDLLVCYGEQAQEIANGAIKSGVVNVASFSDADKVASFVKGYIKEGDTILFKASRGMKLEQVIKMINEE